MTQPINSQYMEPDAIAKWREGLWKKPTVREREEQAKRSLERVARWTALQKEEREIKAETIRLERMAVEQEERRRKERQRQQEEEREIKAETIKMERMALDREERRRKERQRQQEEEHRQQYEHRWKALLDPRTRDHEPLTFGDIPWPLFPVRFEGRRVSCTELRLEDITPEAISAFILPDVDGAMSPAKCDDVSKRNRDKLRATLLRFHPDKFNGRFMHLVPASDVKSVREAVGQVAKVLNILMSGKS